MANSARKSRPQLKIVTNESPATKRRRLTVVGQVRAAFKTGGLAALLGAAFGALVPIAAHTLGERAESFVDIHSGVGATISIALCLACLLFSAPTVFAWMREAFGAKPKALGFVVLLEGLLVLGAPLGVAWLSWTALAYLVFVNAVSCAVRFGRA